jgi:hypothetical protein
VTLLLKSIALLKPPQKILESNFPLAPLSVLKPAEPQAPARKMTSSVMTQNACRSVRPPSMKPLELLTADNDDLIANLVLR